MKRILQILSAGLMLSQAGAGELPEFKPLFNGTNLSGWTAIGSGNFYVTNGVIRAEGGKAWLCSERTYTNFICEVEWRGLESNYNSGIFVRAPREGNPWATNVWQINTKQSAIGELLEGSTKVVRVNAAPLPAGEWIKFRIEAQGPELSLDVNGHRAWQFSEFTPARGYLGLQAEGKTFEFRNLQVKERP